MTNNAASSSGDIDTLVGQAWSQHYQGQNDNALKMFQDLVDKWPDHIDANYGLALTLRALGQKEKSSETFHKTKQLVEVALNNQGQESARFQMLSRMIDQQLKLIA
jgi:thioredoxin-like negative regulator of GroEL